MKIHFISAMAFSLLTLISNLFSAPLENDLLEMLRSNSHVKTVSIKDSDTLMGTFSDGTAFEFQLSNLKKEISNAPAQKDALIQKYLRSHNYTFNQVSGSPKLSPETIYPIVRNISIAKELHDKGVDLNLLPGAQISKDLVVFYVDDAAETMSYLTLKRIEAIGVTKENIMDVAMKNLKKVFLETTFVKSGDYSTATGDSDYISSLMLAPGLWDQVREKEHGNPVVGVPARDVIFYTTDADQRGLEAVRSKTTDIFQKTDHPLSGNLYRWHDDRWEVFPNE
jgi:uncharacterized protein YtpQ (UPF0354 family)